MAQTITPPPLPGDEAPTQRPTLVWVIFIYYWIVLLVSLFAFAVCAIALYFKKPLPLSEFDIGAELLALIVRGLGVFRLFYLKADAWMYLSTAYLITFVINVMHQVERALLGDLHEQQWGNIYMAAFSFVIGSVIQIAIIVYAYRMANPVRKAPSLQV